ncbi:MAG TPA: HlyD family efflux transporter periplasmic adaptor subunit [Thermodesulfobacteriaceae bacterium]|nr:HlyD family efflux transporter periplasmic adaptor subunit [Thermodesulfobacteriaceae bacterium]
MKIKRPIILLVIAALAGSGYWYFRTMKQEPENQLLLYGNVDLRQVQLAFHSTGRIDRILVQEGDQVKAGQLLGSVDPVRYQATLQRLQAEVSAQQQVVARLESGSRPQEIEEARAGVKAREARLQETTVTFERLQRLQRQKGASKQQVDNARAAYLSARADLSAARQTLDLVIQGPRIEDIAAAKASLRAKEAAVTLARQELADTSIYAPSAGIIRDRILEPGDMAFPATPVLTLALTDPLWVRAYIPESDLGKIRPGMAAGIHTDSFPNKTYQGWVGYISPTAEFTPKTVETPALRTRLVYQVRVFACNPEHQLRPGMPATVVFDLARTETPGKAVCGQ